MKIRIGTIIFVLMVLGYTIGKIGGFSGVVFLVSAFSLGALINAASKGHTVDVL